MTSRREKEVERKVWRGEGSANIHAPGIDRVEATLSHFNENSKPIDRVHKGCKFAFKVA